MVFTKYQFIASLTAYINRFAETHIIVRGREYYRGNSVSLSSFNSTGGVIKFNVQGTYDYETIIILKGIPNQWKGIDSTDCDCPAAEHSFCKHQAATLLWLKDNLPQLEGKNDSSLANNPKAITAQKSAASAKRTKAELTPKLRPSDEPYLIEHFEQVETFMKYHAGQFYELPYRGIEAITETATGEFLIQTWFSFHDNLRFADRYKIGLEIKSKALLVTCTCREMVKGLCKHSARILDVMRATGLIAQLRLPSNEALDKAGREAMHHYGLTPPENWPLYFHSQFESTGRSLQLRPEHSNILDILKVKQLMNNHPLKVSETDTISSRYIVSNEPDTEFYSVGFAFCFSDRYERRFGIHTLYALPGKNGEPMSKGFKSAQRFEKHHLVQYSRTDRVIEQFVSTQFERKVGGPNIAIHVARLLTDVVDELDAHPRLFITQEFIDQKVTKGDLKSIQFRKGFPNMRYEIEKNGAMLSLNLFINHNGEAILAEAKRIRTPYPHFMLIDDTLYFSASPAEANHLQLALKLHDSLLPQARFAEIFNEHLAPLFSKYPLTVKGDSELDVLLQKRTVVAWELYLSEMGNFVMFKPCLRYDDDTLVDLLGDGEVWEANDKGLRAKSHHAEEGVRYLEILRAAHPDFKNQFRSDFFFLPYKALLDEYKFVQLFTQLRDADVKIFGQKNLTQLKKIPIPAEVSYTVKREIDWFELNATFVFGDQSITLAQLRKRFVPGSQFVDLGNGNKGSLPMDWYMKLMRIYQHGQNKDEGVRLSAFHFNVIDELFKELNDPDIDSFIAERREKLLNFRGPVPVPLPRGIKATLRPYQTDGFQWLCFLHEFKWGGILADDMGLGKTLQMITFLKHVLKTDTQCNLVVVPTSLLFNWENELKKFAPAITYHVHYGGARHRDTSYFDKVHLVLTSYGNAVSDAEWLREYTFNYIILDESQAIKNPMSKRYKAVRLLNGRNRIAMTGTPVENNTFDLYAQLSFTNPGMMGSSAQFKEYYAKAIDSKQDSTRATELQRTVQPFILRRTKEQVARELPDKVEDIIYCEMDKAQRKVYDAHRNEIRETMLGNAQSEILTTERFKVLQALTRLRQVCNSPLLLPGNEKFVGTSVKIDTLMDHIREKTGNHKILVFSQFTQMLGLIQQALQREDIRYAYLDGSCTTKQRQAAVEAFQTVAECRVFLISLKAGGTGLNLMAADYVYIVDPWWNPAVENQAIDRCYRIGQDKKVIAYRMICKDTVEEKIQELQNRKKKLASDLISTDEGILQKLNEAELKSLFL